jgi:hypothetical protein
VKKILLLITLALLSGCNKTSEDTVIYKDPVPVYRWMDREIYLAFSTGGNANRNNEFQKAKVQEAFNEIAKDSLFLGAGYFSFKEVDEAILQPIVEVGQSPNTYKSFVLIWPDLDFNNFVVNTLGGTVPDQNGVAIINASYKRKFYMILKASCFTSSAACNGISSQGLKGLIARQMGLLVAIPPQTTTQCNADPENVMCPIPNNEQWNDSNKIRFLRSFDNQLEAILNNPNYYDENKVQ